MGKHAQFSQQGLPLGFYDDDVHLVIPAGAVAITEAQWKYFLDNTGKSQWNGTDAVPRVVTLGEAKAEKLAALDADRKRVETLPIAGNQGGKLFTISRPEKINEFLMGGLSIALDPSPAATFTMLDDNGVEVTYSKTLMDQIISFINASKQPALKRYDARKAAIEAAKDAAEVDSVNTDLSVA